VGEDRRADFVQGVNAKVGHNPVPMNIPVILASGEHMGFAFAFVFLAGGSSVV
jgi:hypothetical protein